MLVVEPSAMSGYPLGTTATAEMSAQPSRLELLRQQFQSKLLREREATLNKIREAKRILNEERRRSRKDYSLGSPRSASRTSAALTGGMNRPLYMGIPAPLPPLQSPHALQRETFHGQQVVQSKRPVREMLAARRRHQPQPSSEEEVLDNTINPRAALPPIGTPTEIRSIPVDEAPEAAAPEAAVAVGQRRASGTIRENRRYAAVSPGLGSGPSPTPTHTSTSPETRAATKITKRQRQEAERKAREAERKAQIEYRKQRRNQMHRDRMEQRAAEDAARKAATDADDVDGGAQPDDIVHNMKEVLPPAESFEMLDVPQPIRAGTPSESVVSVGDRVVMDDSRHVARLEVAHEHESITQLGTPQMLGKGDVDEDSSFNHSNHKEQPLRSPTFVVDGSADMTDPNLQKEDSKPAQQETGSEVALEPASSPKLSASLLRRAEKAAVVGVPEFKVQAAPSLLPEDKPDLSHIDTQVDVPMTPRPPSTPRSRGTPVRPRRVARQPEQSQQKIEHPVDLPDAPAMASVSAPTLTPVPDTTTAPSLDLGSLPPDALTSEPVQLSPCEVCGRKFASNRLAKHTVICQKVATKKRKPMNMAQSRVAGTDAAKFAKVRDRNEKKYEKAVEKTSNWRAKSEAFRAAMRAAKDPNAAPLPSFEDPSFVKCDHCGRSFNEAAAQRHIPRCKQATSTAKPKSKPAKPKYDPRAVMKSKR